MDIFECYLLKTHINLTYTEIIWSVCTIIVDMLLAYNKSTTPIDRIVFNLLN